MKICVKGKYEVEVLDALVKKFLETTDISLETRLTFFIRTDLNNDIDLAFKMYSPEKITKTLNQCMIEDICVNLGPEIYQYLDEIGYSNYDKLQL